MTAVQILPHGGRWRGAALRRDGGGRNGLGLHRTHDIAGALDVEADQGAADRNLLSGRAVKRGDDARDRRSQFDSGLVGHDLGEQLVLLDRVTDRDMPGDQFGLGRAFADVGQFEDVVAGGG